MCCVPSDHNGVFNAVSASSVGQYGSKKLILHPQFIVPMVISMNVCSFLYILSFPEVSLH
jgi:hypothetical protein